MTCIVMKKKMFVFFLFGVFGPTREFFTQWHMETSPLSVKGCKFWPCSFWPLSSVGSLACHTYCDTGYPFIMVISEDTRHSHLYCWALSSGAVDTCFYVVGQSLLGFKHPTFRLWGEHSSPLCHSHGKKNVIMVLISMVKKPYSIRQRCPRCLPILAHQSWKFNPLLSILYVNFSYFHLLRLKHWPVNFQI